MKIYPLGSSRNTKALDLDKVALSPAYFEDPENHSFILATLEDFKKHQDLFPFPEGAVNETFDEDQMPRAEFYDDLLFMTLNHLRHDSKQKLEAKEVNIFLGQNNVLVVYHGEEEGISWLSERVDTSHLLRCLYTIIDAILERQKSIIKGVEQKALNLENEILRQVQVDDHEDSGKKSAPPLFTGKRKRKKKTKDADYYMRRLVEIRKDMQFIKAFTDSAPDVLEILEMDESNLIPPEYDRYFSKLSMKADRLDGYIANLRETISQVQSSWQGQVDLSFSKIAKLFTVITAIFTPITFITSWYGMNFQHMKELAYPWSYPAVLAACLLIAGLCILYFRRKHYL